MQLTIVPGLRCPDEGRKGTFGHLDAAYQWLCDSRKNAPPNADVWDLRFRWRNRRESLLAQLEAGAYSLRPMNVVGNQRQVMWSAEDALVLKWVALNVMPLLPLHPKCEHVRGHGGGRTSLTRMQQAILREGYSWVCRTDIQGYYASINKKVLLGQLARHVKHPVLINLLTQYIHYCVEDGGEFYTPERGIARGCALSPLMGALHLWALDHHFSQQENIYYARYMDDVVIMTKTRWSLRRHVKALNGHFEKLSFHQHPDKTYVGQLAKGFDWMGAQLGRAGLQGIAPRALTNHRTKVRRLYEQTRSLPVAERARRVSNYLRRWEIWRRCLVGSLCMWCGTLLAETVQMSHDVRTYDLRGTGPSSREYRAEKRSNSTITIYTPHTKNVSMGSPKYLQLAFRLEDWATPGDYCDITVNASIGGNLSATNATIKSAPGNGFCVTDSNPLVSMVANDGIEILFKLGQNRDRFYVKRFKTISEPTVLVHDVYSPASAGYKVLINDNLGNPPLTQADINLLPAPVSCTATLSSKHVAFGDVSWSDAGDPVTTEVTTVCRSKDGVDARLKVSSALPNSPRGLSLLGTTQPDWYVHAAIGRPTCSPDEGLDLRPGGAAHGFFVSPGKPSAQSIVWNLCYLPDGRNRSRSQGGGLETSALVDVTWD
ncbi:Retron-type reverse transcriptase [Serratia fonticola]|nr:Retron-type reverse transcriptase [Serratia fonticola]